MLSLSTAITTYEIKTVRKYDEKELDLYNYNLDKHCKLVVCKDEKSFSNLEIIPIEKLLNYFGKEVETFEDSDSYRSAYKSIRNSWK